jgi:hypothetical protein
MESPGMLKKKDSYHSSWQLCRADIVMRRLRTSGLSQRDTAVPVVRQTKATHQNLVRLLRVRREEIEPNAGGKEKVDAVVRLL